VLGPNGAGKSTLLRLLSSLLRPSSGAVTVLGSPLPDESHKVRGQIGLVAHEPLLFRELSARENLAYYCGLYGVDEQRCDELLDAIGLGAAREAPLRELSRGTVQRVAIARAVLHRPALLLLDEAYSHLDPAAVELVQPLIGRAAGRTRVLTSHDAAAAVAEADVVLGLRAAHQVLLADARAVDAATIRGLYG
jgi:ABC-type multidrug transport system ATPase subunit